MRAGFFDVCGTAYAHRGLWDAGIPENSAEAFAAANRSGVGVELDVRLTADGEPVVFHDADLMRLCGRPMPLAELRAGDLQDYPLPDGSLIPTLDEALDAMGQLPVLIELKADASPGPIAEQVAAVIRRRDGHLAVMSFDEATVARIRKLAPDRPVGLLVYEERPTRAFVARKARLARSFGCDYMAPHHSLLEMTAEASGGLPLVTWTVRTANELMLARTYDAAPIFETLPASLAKAIKA